jgi:DNA-binding response OmpR family regulator
MSAVDYGANGTPDSYPEKVALILTTGRDAAIQQLESFLAEKSYRLELVSDGAAALSQARQLKPLLLVTEVLTPKLDGLSLCRILKRDAATSPMRILVASHLLAREQAEAAGADAFLLKPLNAEELINTVRVLIDDDRPTQATASR